MAYTPNLRLDAPTIIESEEATPAVVLNDNEADQAVGIEMPHPPFKTRHSLTRKSPRIPKSRFPQHPAKPDLPILAT